MGGNRLPINDHEPNRAEGIAYQHAHRHSHHIAQQLQSRTLFPGEAAAVNHQGSDVNRRNEADDVATGNAEQLAHTAGKPGKYRQADEPNEHVSQHGHGS